MKHDKRLQMLAYKLRSVRITSGLSQHEIASRLHKPQSYISRCESGARRIDVFELQEFARVYQKPLTFFVENPSVVLERK